MTSSVHRGAKAQHQVDGAWNDDQARDGDGADDEELRKQISPNFSTPQNRPPFRTSSATRTYIVSKTLFILPRIARRFELLRNVIVSKAKRFVIQALLQDAERKDAISKEQTFILYGFQEDLNREAKRVEAEIQSFLEKRKSLEKQLRRLDR